MGQVVAVLVLSDRPELGRVQPVRPAAVTENQSLPKCALTAVRRSSASVPSGLVNDKPPQDLGSLPRWQSSKMANYIPKQPATITIHLGLASLEGGAR
jgi:hypothetical protein